MSDIRIRVLKNKKTGKSASRSDAQYLANVMHLLSLKRSGRATGIATLQPTMTQQLQRKINHVSKLYRLDWIVPRKSRLAAGARRCLSSRSIRAMMLKLYLEYEDTLKSKNKSYRAPKTLKRFLDWVVDSRRIINLHCQCISGLTRPISITSIRVTPAHVVVGGGQSNSLSTGFKSAELRIFVSKRVFGSGTLPPSTQIDGATR